jgi:hypothetical protein
MFSRLKNQLNRFFENDIAVLKYVAINRHISILVHRH